MCTFVSFTNRHEYFCWRIISRGDIIYKSGKWLHLNKRWINLMLGDNDAVLGFFLWLLDSTLQMERNCRTQKRECSRHEQKQKAPDCWIVGPPADFLIDENFSAKCFQISRDRKAVYFRLLF